MPRLSILIPCLGGSAEFEGTLVSVLQNRPAHCEVLVLHTAPYDDPYALQNEVRFIQVAGDTLVALLNRGVEEAGGEILQMVGGGLEITEGCAEAVLHHFDDPDVAAVSPIVVHKQNQELLSAGVRWSQGGSRRVVRDKRLLSPGAGRLRAKILGPTLTAAFYRRDVLAAMGGFDESLGDDLADVATALEIEALGRLQVCEPAARLISTCAEPSAVRPGFSASRAAERLFWWHASSRGLFLSLAMHPLACAADACRSSSLRTAVTSLAGRAAALLEIGANNRHQQRLADAQERLADLAKLRSTVRLPSASREAAPALPARRRAA